jgi:hypothetical protein
LEALRYAFRLSLADTKRLADLSRSPKLIEPDAG